MSALVYSLSGYSYDQFHLLCSHLVLVVMHKALRHNLPFAKEPETETSLWNKTGKKPQKLKKTKKAKYLPQSSPGERASCQWWREGVGEGGIRTISHRSNADFSQWY